MTCSAGPRTRYDRCERLRKRRVGPSPPGANRPPPAKVHWLEPDQDWTEAPELGQLAKIFNQDTFNLPKVQLGLKAQEQQEVVFASYNETKLRHFHELLQRWVGEI